MAIRKSPETEAADGAQRGQEWSCWASGAYLSMGGGGAKRPHGSINVAMPLSSLCRQHAWAKHCPFPMPLRVGRSLDGQPVGLGVYFGSLSLARGLERRHPPHPMPPHPSLVQPPLSSRFPEHLLPVTTRLLPLGVSNQIHEFLPPCPSDGPPTPGFPQACGLSCHHPACFLQHLPAPSSSPLRVTWVPAPHCLPSILTIPFQNHSCAPTTVFSGTPSPPSTPGAHGFLGKNPFCGIRGPGQLVPGPPIRHLCGLDANPTCLCFLTHTQLLDASVPPQTHCPPPRAPPPLPLFTLWPPLQRACPLRLSLPLSSSPTGHGSFLLRAPRPRVESQLFNCLFYLLYQTGSSPRVDDGFESSAGPRYPLVQRWAQRRKLGGRRKEKHERREREGESNPERLTNESRHSDPAALLARVHPHQLCSETTQEQKGQNSPRTHSQTWDRAQDSTAGRCGR